ncbi:hypothetical protein EOW77_0019380 [Bradyrhizobium yuanmingense]|nr:hypothetical protein EOW77_0019380 [Bradyrhizobium yuanmingense]
MPDQGLRRARRPRRGDARAPGLIRLKADCPSRLKRDAIRVNRHRALGYCLSMIFSENRYTLFRIML